MEQKMPDIIKKDGFEISIDMETGEVIIQTTDYHPSRLNIDVELAEKILIAAQRRLEYLKTHVPENSKEDDKDDDEPEFIVEIPE